MARKSKFADMYTLRSDGRYQGYYRDQDGKRHAVYNRDPEALHNEIQRRIEAGGKPKTFRDIAEAWHKETWDKLPSGTRASYSAHYDRAVERMGDREAETIEPVDIQNHLKYLAAQRYTASTISKQRTMYSLIFSNAITTGLLKIRISPVDATKVPRKDAKPATKREAPETEVVQLIQASAASVPFGDFALYLLCTGARRGEGAAAQWQDTLKYKDYIDIHESVTYHEGLHINAPKTNAGTRKVPKLVPLLPYLVMPPDAKPTDYIFHGEDPSKPLPESTLKRRWLSYCKAIGMYTDEPEIHVSEKNGHTYVKHHYKPTLTPHMLRHGYATLLFEAGVDEETACSYMGHSDIAITRAVYTHLRKRQEQAGKNKLIAHTADGLK